MGLLCLGRPLHNPAWRLTLAIGTRGAAHHLAGSLAPLASAQQVPAGAGGVRTASSSSTGSGSGGSSSSSSSAFTPLPPDGRVTAAGMVQTRRGAAAELAETCRLERVVSNLRASCSATPVGPPVRGPVGPGGLIFFTRAAVGRAWRSYASPKGCRHLAGATRCMPAQGVPPPAPAPPLVAGVQSLCSSPCSPL